MNHSPDASALNTISRRQFQASLAAIAMTGAYVSPRDVSAQEADPRTPYRETANSQPALRQPTATGSNVAATVHPIASQAAIKIYRQGGNAVDAAIAAALCLGVVDGHNSGIGGGCLMLIRTARGEIHAIDGRETAPAAASEKMYHRDGKPLPELSQTGALACAVPGQIAALKLAHEKLGVLKWPVLFESAIEAADLGFAVSYANQRAIAAQREKLLNFEASRSVLLRPDGSPPNIGDILRQTDLAETLRQIAKNGPEWFYRGEFAQSSTQYLQKLGGVLTQEDFGRYKAIERKCLRTNYRDREIIGFPTPSSGGIHIAQMLHMLEQFDVASIYAKSQSEFFHLLVECMKRAFADRAHWLGDSDFVKVPDFLLDPNYAKSLASQIRLDKASTDVNHGNPVVDDHHKHTTHLTTADALGNWVALTCTVNTGWGCKVMVPGTGVMLNNEMDDFSISPGTPNAFGLVGSAANAIAPRKRPLSSMSPTIVLSKDGTPVLTCGAAGGPKIINATLQAIVRCIDLKEPVDQAIASARVHHQWRPDVVSYEPNLGSLRGTSNEKEIDMTEISSGLEKLGHPLKLLDPIAIAQGIQKTQSGLLAATDPRTKGEAVAWN
ncbi:MAG: gamma-glutamyltransferase [Planctomycetota bacterium]|nr:gamma-glutamyltransferase [Planctomycetota bacterium]